MPDYNYQQQGLNVQGYMMSPPNNYVPPNQRGRFLQAGNGAGYHLGSGVPSQMPNLAHSLPLQYHVPQPYFPQPYFPQPYFGPAQQVPQHLPMDLEFMIPGGPAQPPAHQYEPMYQEFGGLAGVSQMAGQPVQGFAAPYALVDVAAMAVIPPLPGLQAQGARPQLGAHAAVWAQAAAHQHNAMPHGIGEPAGAPYMAGWPAQGPPQLPVSAADMAGLPPSHALEAQGGSPHLGAPAPNVAQPPVRTSKKSRSRGNRMHKSTVCYHCRNKGKSMCDGVREGGRGSKLVTACKACVRAKRRCWSQDHPQEHAGNLSTEQLNNRTYPYPLGENTPTTYRGEVEDHFPSAANDAGAGPNGHHNQVVAAEPQPEADDLVLDDMLSDAAQWLPNDAPVQVYGGQGGHVNGFVNQELLDQQVQQIGAVVAPSVIVADDPAVLGNGPYYAQAQPAEGHLPGQLAHSPAVAELGPADWADVNQSLGLAPQIQEPNYMLQGEQMPFEDNGIPETIDLDAILAEADDQPIEPAQQIPPPELMPQPPQSLGAREDWIRSMSVITGGAEIGPQWLVAFDMSIEAAEQIRMAQDGQIPLRDGPDPENMNLRAALVEAGDHPIEPAQQYHPPEQMAQDQQEPADALGHFNPADLNGDPADFDMGEFLDLQMLANAGVNIPA